MSSFAQVLTEVIADKRLSAIEFRLYAALLDFGFKGRGHSDCGHDFLGRYLGVHPKTIARALRHLSELGYIEVQRMGLKRKDRIRCLITPKKENVRERQCSIKRERQRPIKYNIIDKNKKIIDTSKPTPIVDNSKNGGNHKPKDPDRKIDQQETIACHGLLQDQISPKSYDTWLKGLEVAESSDDKLKIRLAGSFISYDWVEKHYLTQMQEILGKKVQLVE